MNVSCFLNYPADNYCPDPQLDTWGNYRDQDTLKLAVFAMNSWRRLGWTVARHGSPNAYNGFGSFNSRILNESIDKGYTLRFWNQWHTMLTMYQSDSEWRFWTTADVHNNRYDDLRAIGDCQTAEYSGKIMVNLECGRLSHAAFACKKEYVQRMIDCIRLVDAGKLEINETIQLVSDESIARDCLSDYCYFAEKMTIAAYDYKADLNHLSRSYLRHVDGIYPYYEN